MPTILRLKNYIGGNWQSSESARWTPDINPSDQQDIIAEVPEGTREDVKAAVAAAASAAPAWRALAGSARAEWLYQWAAALSERGEELAQAMAREVGKPISEARGELARGSAILRYYAGEAVRDIGEVIPAQAPGALQFTLRSPLGVVALITPWNFPIAIPLWKAAPALAFGNTVVLKPAEASSHMAVLLAETAAKAGLPAGVFNVVTGSGAVIGPGLLRAPEVSAVSFTGSGKVGTQVAAIAAERNIRYQTEMGGKNVAIVMPDADLEQAAVLTAGGAMRYAGQKCTATSRVVVAKEVERKFLDRLRHHVKELPLGSVSDPKTAIGPVISDQARTSIRVALEEVNADPEYAGVVPAGDAFDRGFFLPPVVLCGIAPDSHLAQQELFGPVLVSFAAQDLDHAIQLANGTRYGLSASLFTRDLRAALTYIERIEAGLVRVNGDTTGVDPHAPFGGMKGSSSGTREQGRAAREFYTEIKTVQVNP
ncbi:MAG TPA: aldehyde dehydrogenase family protein [Gemmatimonadales bacterium]|jgi:aldehyde dehydrogenase (NAD+)|nr:aldehyde dehydrogenase family protein [Gemmatimonadales bacterium]